MSFSTPSSSTAQCDSHLSFPTPDIPDDAVPSTSSSHRSPMLLKDRLYVGNLHPTIDEYALLQIFSKFGKVTKLDFLFHKTGPRKGKPRGYAFIEFGDQTDALKALGAANGKLLRGRQIVVTHAHQAPLDQAGTLVSGTKFRKGTLESNRPTALSMLKTGLGSRTGGTKDKIAMIEAKLRQMEQSSITPTFSNPSTPMHPSLPMKPKSLSSDKTNFRPRSRQKVVTGSEASTITPIFTSSEAVNFGEQEKPPKKLELE